MTKPIGELNGKWAMMLKFTLVCFPIFTGLIATWAIWVTCEIFESRSFRALHAVNDTPRVTAMEKKQDTIHENQIRMMVKLDNLSQKID